MRWFDLLAVVRLMVDGIRKILAQIRAFKKKQRLEDEIRRKDDRYTIDSIRDLL